MENFVLYNPTSLHFGRGVCDKLGTTAAGIGRHALLVYGKGSVKASGAYDAVVSQLRQQNISFVEYAGIRSNPVVEDVDAAAQLGRQHNVDVIVAVGGGSVIDSAKMIAIAIPVEHGAWDFVAGKAKPKSAIPLVAVLTLAATGTEMNRFAVVQNHDTQQKLGYRSDLMYPRHSFLDPSFTFSVPANYTAYGITDLIAHALEAWFGEGDAPLSDKFTGAIIREAMEAGPALLQNLQDYDLRARIMYAATSALNGLTLYGKTSGDWGVHSIGHILSLLYDVPHGASLSIVYPAWMKLLSQRIPERIALLGKEVFGVDDVEVTIRRFEDFFLSIGSPVRLKPFAPQADAQEIVRLMKDNRAATYVHKLSEPDYQVLTDLFM
ncbi:MAG TPA: iron-containing alcohol dehydrogenase [Bacteroidales bacterium]|nr:iron-containing alcohol dehydrogenase [Bacteroidales bacterium]